MNVWVIFITWGMDSRPRKDLLKGVANELKIHKDVNRV